MKISALLCVMVSASAVMGAEMKQEGQPKPNVVFFLVDDLGSGEVGCYASKFHDKSPGSEVAFTVKGTDITFIPIWDTANELQFGGTKTYFGIEGNPNVPQVYTKTEKDRTNIKKVNMKLN